MSNSELSILSWKIINFTSRCLSYVQERASFELAIGASAADVASGKVLFTDHHGGVDNGPAWGSSCCNPQLQAYHFQFISGTSLVSRGSKLGQSLPSKILPYLSLHMLAIKIF